MAQQQPAFNVLKTFAFEDWGLYGRGDELLCRALAKHPKVGKVFHVQPPADPAGFRTRFRDPRWDQDLEGQLRRLRGDDDGGVLLFTPRTSPERPDAALDRTVEFLERERAFASPLVLLQTLTHPFAADIARRLGGRGVFRLAMARRDARAAHDSGSGERERFEELYATQVPGADLVWAGTRPLVEEFRARNPRTVLQPVGADQGLAGGTPAEELADLPRPLVVYAGSMRADLDVPLIRGTAERLADHSFVFVGPHADHLVPLVEGVRNVHVIGPRPYRQLPDHLAAAEVAIAPHLVVEATKAVVPEKLYGYLAAGLPVVTTAVAGVEELRRLVWTARDAGEFARAIQGARKRDRERRRSLRQAAVTPLSWDAVADHLVASVEAVRGGADPPATPEARIPAIPGFLAR
ncbi:MAG TPA: glycosyltransferase [Actinomycetes bacterium]|nr:glycosyltransferase [Actinomycetes bacterium]